MTDILLHTDFDLLIVAGDFVTGESTEQHQELLLLTAKGDWRESPTVGVGAKGFLKDDSGYSLLGEIKKEFERDGMNVSSVSMTADKINVKAVYK